MVGSLEVDRWNDLVAFRKDFISFLITIEYQVGQQHLPWCTHTIAVVIKVPIESAGLNTHRLKIRPYVLLVLPIV